MFAHTKFNMLCTSSLVVQFSKINTAAPILHSPSGESPCRSVPSLCDSLYIIPHFLSLVKGFSKSFLKFFSKVFRKASETVSFSHRLTFGWYFLHPHFQALDYYTTFCSVCQEVFRKFFEVFFVGFRSSTSRYGFASSAFPLASVPWPSSNPRFERLIIIPLFCAPVKRFCGKNIHKNTAGSTSKNSPFHSRSFCSHKAPLRTQKSAGALPDIQQKSDFRNGNLDLVACLGRLRDAVDNRLVVQNLR